MIDTVDQALRQVAWLDHRHTITHAQLSTQAQLRRMAALLSSVSSKHTSSSGVQKFPLNVTRDNCGVGSVAKTQFRTVHARENGLK